MAYAKPTSVTLTDTCGRYTRGSNGVSYTVKGTTNYYVYACDPTTYKWYKKGQITSSSGISIKLGQNDTTSEQYTTWVILSDTDYGSSAITVGDEYSSYKYGLNIPLIVAGIFNGSSSDWYNSAYDDIASWTKSGYTLVGWTNLPTSTTVKYTDWDTAMDGKVLYTIWYKAASTSSKTCYYYRGSSTRKSVTKTITTSSKYIYGQGSTIGGSESSSYGSMTTSCLSDSSYGLEGWSTSSSSKTISYTNATDAFDDGYTTIYGVYYKEGSSSQSTYYYYRGSSTKNSVKKTTTISDGYYYGKGTSSGGTTSYSYGTITTSCLSDSSYSLVGWTSDSSSTTTEYTDIEDAFNSYTTIYGVYNKTETMIYQPKNGETSNSVSVTNYIYGSGLATSNIPTEPSLTYEGYTFEGWSSSNTSETADTWENQWNNGIRTVYAVWTKDGSIYFGVGDSWVATYTYKGTIVDGTLTWVSMSVDDLMNYVG